MLKLMQTRRGNGPGEEGYILAFVIFMMAILIIGMAVAAPKIARSIQRDRELETMQRGKQYVRAIKLYYRKFGTYPTNVDALVNTNQIRFLRQRYVDPMTGTDDWKPIRLGQNKTPVAMGFFGEPLGIAGSPLGGNGVGGGNGIAGAATLGSAFGTSGSGADSTGTQARVRRATRAATLPRLREQTLETRFLEGGPSSGFRRRAPRSPFWFTRRRTTTTSGSFSTLRWRIKGLTTTFR
jgi:type II secretory pathway pseudopilin PulG